MQDFAVSDKGLPPQARIRRIAVLPEESGLRQVRAIHNTFWLPCPQDSYPTILRNPHMYLIDTLFEAALPWQSRFRFIFPAIPLTRKRLRFPRQDA